MLCRQKVAFVIQSLPKQSDSVGFDCINQYLLLKSDESETFDVRIFCDDNKFSDVKIVESYRISELPSWLEGSSDACVVYHWRDGWAAFDNVFPQLNARRIIRWHNNTPPWFFAPYSTLAAANTVRGLASIRKLIAETDVEFWANSAYSAGQLRTLGASAARIGIVHPMSPLLIAQQDEIEADLRIEDQPSADAEPGIEQNAAIRLLFVGRFVPHKGHKHLVATAAHVQAMSGTGVELHIVGRPDRAMQGYVDETMRLAAQLGVKLIDHGEVSGATLHQLYRSSDVFLFLSEHEGFGLPVLEAMRFELPVVGLKSTATAELLAEHPLAIDALDHEAAAHRVIAALQQPVRAAVVRWQKQQALANYSETAIARRFYDTLADVETTEPVQLHEDAILSSLVEVAVTALERAPRLPETHAAIIRNIPADASSRIVTLYDLDAYGALLRQVSEGAGEDLYKSTWRSGFPRKRRMLSQFYRQLRRAAFSLNFGIITAIDHAARRSDIRLERLADEVESLREQNAVILDRLKLLTAERETSVEAARLATAVPSRVLKAMPMLQSVTQQNAALAPVSESAGSRSA